MYCLTNRAVKSIPFLNNLTDCLLSVENKPLDIVNIDENQENWIHDWGIKQFVYLTRFVCDGQVANIIYFGT